MRTRSPSPTAPQRNLAMLALCLGMLMIQVDTTIVNVALPSIKQALQFDSVLLSWVVNVYMLSFGGMLILTGRLGDLYGHRRLFLLGLVVFTLASLGCGVATQQAYLIISRAIQGMGGAAMMSVSMSLLVDLYPEPNERAKAMGLYAFVATCGGGIGLVLGGILTHWLGWPSIFLVNLPLSIATIMITLRAIPARRSGEHPKLDVAGAISITSGLMLAMYAVTSAGSSGLGARAVVVSTFFAALLLITFLIIQSRSVEPLIPPRLIRQRNLALANITVVLWASANYAWFILCALYLQGVLQMDPLRVGLAFLPTPIFGGIISLKFAAPAVARFGFRAPIASGLLFCVAGYALFARLPIEGSYLHDVLPGMILLGVGLGLVFSPALLAAMSGTTPADSGLASGIVNTSSMMGGAIGVAVLVSVAGVRNERLLQAGQSVIAAQVGGYHFAFLICLLLSLLGAVTSLGLREQPVAALATH